jgi:acetyltransferase-like isoleucine patch superfamily enzyme
MNTLFNVISGNITIGDNTLFTHNCMVLTGTHNFYNGKLASLNNPPELEVPNQGRDIVIGSGCFIGSGAIILGNVIIGDNVIIAAGSVVTNDVPSNCFAGGIPAKVIHFHTL